MKTKGLSENDAITLMKKYQPVFYFHKDESAFPTNLNDFPIEWTKLTYDNKDAEASSIWGSYKGKTSADSSVPVYASILENSDGTARITYMVTYAFNPAGPAFKFKAKCTGVGIDTSVTVGDYGLGVHYTDVEHIEVNLNSGYGSVKSVKYAFHSDDETLNSSDVEYEDSTHPVVYVAKGSHASYWDAGDYDYQKFWDEKKTKKVVFVKVTVYDTYGKLTDKPPSSKSNGTRWYSSNPRLLKLNGNQVSATGLSTAEYYCGFRFSGRMGPQYTNPNMSGLKSALGYNTFMTVLKTLDKGTYNDINDAVDDWAAEMEIEAKGSNCFYGRSFW